MHDRVTHLSQRRRPCAERDHGTMDETVPADATYDGVARPGWAGVRWEGGDSARHPLANLLVCTCQTD